MKEMTVIQYAKTVNLTRLAVYKQIRENRLPSGVFVKTYLGRLVIFVVNEKAEAI